MALEVKIEKLSKEELEKRGIFSWPIWEKEPSRFDWYYDSQEQCYFLEGDVTVQTEDGQYHIQAGDFVTFPQGLKCTWIVNQKVKKHYNFG